MVVDGRRDHSFSVPRPDESVRYGTPNACTDCHRERDPAWAAKAVAAWFGPGAAARPSFTPSLHAGRAGWPEAGTLLSRVVNDAGAPAIVRATALSMLRPESAPDAASTIDRASADADPLVRRSAASAAALLDQTTAIRIAGALLEDPVRTVRFEAVRALADRGAAEGAPGLGARVARTADELRVSLRFNADRAESHVALGALEAALGRVAEAEVEYRTAIRLQPEFAPAYVNLADLLRSTARDREAETMLKDAIGRLPAEAHPSLNHALGLALVRQRRYGEAIAVLRLAAESSPENARFAFVYGVALHDTGQAPSAIRVLAEAAKRHPADPSVLDALVTYHVEAGDRAAAARWAERLSAALPGNAEALRRWQELRR